MNESYVALQQVKSLRAQLKARAEKAGKGKLADAIAALDKEAAELEGGTREAFAGLPPAGKQPENLSTVNQHFGELLNVVDSADAAPTAQAAALYAELQTALKPLLARWDALKNKSVPALNQEAKAFGLPPIVLHRPAPPAAGESSAGGDDEP
jgi:hypothetical protein